jgi:hypothetical protein
VRQLHGDVELGLSTECAEGEEAEDQTHSSWGDSEIESGIHGKGNTKMQPFSQSPSP